MLEASSAQNVPERLIIGRVCSPSDVGNTNADRLQAMGARSNRTISVLREPQADWRDQAPRRHSRQAEHRDHRRLREILTFATEIEHAGDIVDNNLLGIANKMVKRGVTFSKSG